MAKASVPESVVTDDDAADILFTSVVTIVSVLLFAALIVLVYRHRRLSEEHHDSAAAESARSVNTAIIEHAARMRVVHDRIREAHQRGAFLATKSLSTGATPGALQTTIAEEELGFARPIHGGSLGQRRGTSAKEQAQLLNGTATSEGYGSTTHGS